MSSDQNLSKRKCECLGEIEEGLATAKLSADSKSTKASIPAVVEENGPGGSLEGNTDSSGSVNDVKEGTGQTIQSFPAVNIAQRKLLRAAKTNALNLASYLVINRAHLAAFVAAVNSSEAHKARIPDYIMSTLHTDTNPLTSQVILDGMLRAALTASGRTTPTQQASARLDEAITCTLAQFAYVQARYVNMCHEDFFIQVATTHPHIFPLAHHTMIVDTKTFLPEAVPVDGGANVIR